MRKRFLLGLVLTIPAALGIVFFWVITPSPDIRRASFQQLRAGQTEAEVEAVLGVPPGDYGDGFPVPAELSMRVASFGDYRAAGIDRTWQGSGAVIRIRFDAGQAVYGQCLEWLPGGVPFSVRVRRWLWLD